ncbi:tubulin-binding prefolding complex subunit [Maudiozyma humilis]|uniref:Prefoldin subunit 3 n=1 Tax=Maudiozyma humilis TaxID=51915 RepID=A0AAV5S0A8_MAUHU|nr:tubulin-binding prefolding complex subunit [Kazachstania humilis]
MDSIFNSTEKNPRGIPAAPFVEDPEQFIKDPSDFEMVFGKFQERLSMYKYMQESKAASVKQLRVRIPDIEHTLRVCERLQESAEPELELNYQLNDTLYTRATVKTAADESGEVPKVGLWLGADVMLEYPVPEALELLAQKLKDAEQSLELATEDVEFLRENITTMEVNCARLYNWDVERRQAQRAAEATKDLKI